MATTTRNRRLVIFAVVLAMASVVGVLAVVLRPGSSAMPGMDMATSQMPQSFPSQATMSGEMPGMDHGTAEKPASTPSPTMSGEMPGMDHGTAETPGTTSEHGDAVEVASDRPLAPVLGTFGGGAAVVLLTAGMMRRKDRAASAAKGAARAARRAQK